MTMTEDGDAVTGLARPDRRASRIRAAQTGERVLGRWSRPAAAAATCDISDKGLRLVSARVLSEFYLH